MMRKLVIRVVLMATVFCSGCGRGLPSSPTPVPQPTPTPRPQTFTLSGTVSETAPTASTRIAGASVWITDGPNAGLSATSDANGAFRFASIQPGTFTVATGAEDYIARSQGFTLTADQTVTIELDPVFQMLTTTRNDFLSGGGDACAGSWDDPPIPDPCRVEYMLDVHHNGNFTAGLTSTDPETEFWVELYGPGSRSGMLRGRMSAEVFARRQYVVVVRESSRVVGDRPPPGIAPFSLTLTRPN